MDLLLRRLFPLSRPIEVVPVIQIVDGVLLYSITHISHLPLICVPRGLASAYLGTLPASLSESDWLSPKPVWPFVELSWIRLIRDCLFIRLSAGAVPGTPVSASPAHDFSQSSLASVVVRSTVWSANLPRGSRTGASTLGQPNLLEDPGYWWMPRSGWCTMSSSKTGGSRDEGPLGSVRRQRLHRLWFVANKMILRVPTEPSIDQKLSER